MGYIEAINAKRWQILDVTDEPDGAPYWDRRAQIAPANAVEPGRHYLFTPQPEDGQTLWDAYLAVQGVGSCIRISDPAAPEYKDMALRYSPTFAIFSRMVVARSGVMLYAPTQPNVAWTDIVLLDPVLAEPAFEQQFDIITRPEIAQAIQDWRTGENVN